jgi:hypothetical protein
MSVEMNIRWEDGFPSGGPRLLARATGKSGNYSEGGPSAYPRRALLLRCATFGRGGARGEGQGGGGEYEDRRRGKRGPVAVAGSEARFTASGAG